MKIGVMGGTYNPPHIGHMHAAQQAKQFLQLDEIIFVPANIPPHKMLPTDAPDAAHRLAMTKIAARQIAAQVSDIEILRDGMSYTADTIEQLAKRYPRDELFLIIGTDMFLTIQDWYQPERIFKAATLAVVAREKGERQKITTQAEALSQKGARVRVISGKPLVISSTELRNRISEPEMRRFLPNGVWEYIVQEHLYGV